MRQLTVYFFLLTALPLWATESGDLRTGGKLYKQAKYGQALSAYNAILQENPANQEAAIGAGTSAYYLKDYAAAESAFKQAAGQDTPRQNDALFNLGNTYYRAKKSDEAKQAYRQVILNNPQDKEALHNLQLLLEQESSQNNQNNQNQQNQDQSQNQQQNQDPQQNNSQGEQNSQQQPVSQEQKDTADRIMQMAKDQEHKPSGRNPGSSANEFIEKDW